MGGLQGRKLLLPARAVERRIRKRDATTALILGLGLVCRGQEWPVQLWQRSGIYPRDQDRRMAGRASLASLLMGNDQAEAQGLGVGSTDAEVRQGNWCASVDSPGRA